MGKKVLIYNECRFKQKDMTDCSNDQWFQLFVSALRKNNAEIEETFFLTYILTGKYNVAAMDVLILKSSQISEHFSLANYLTKEYPNLRIVLIGYGIEGKFPEQVKVIDQKKCLSQDEIMKIILG